MPLVPEKGAEPNYKNPRVEPADHGLGHSRGGWSTKSHVAVDPSGHLRSVVVTPGQAGENPRLLDVLDTTGAKVCRVVADKAYSHPSTRAEMRRRRIAVTIPERDDQIAHRRKHPGRPIDFGQAQQERYKGRNVVERGFNTVKQWRGLATRYDKLAIVYRGAAVLRAITLWLKRLRDTP